MPTTTQKPFFPTPTGQPITQPFYPTPTGAPIPPSSFIPKIASTIKPTFNTESIINNLSSKIQGFDINSITRNLASKYGITTPDTKLKESNMKIIPPNFGDVAQLPSYLLGQAIKPFYMLGSTVIEELTKLKMPKLEAPLLFNKEGGFFGKEKLLDTASARRMFEDKINEGISIEDAYKDVLTEGIINAFFVASPIKTGIKTGLTKFAPESLIKTEKITFPKETAYDYFSGRKTAEQLGITPQQKTLITSKLKSMTTQEKAQFLQGFDLLNAKPTILGKMFGITETEAKAMLDSFGGQARTSPTGELPGYKMNYEAGGANIKGEPVGFGENSLTNEAKKYKSAEEFVKAQGTFNPKNIEYHGTGKSFDKFMLGEEGSSGAGTENLGVFTTKSKEAAKFWAEKSAGVGKNGKVMEVYLDIKNPKIFKSQQALDDFLGDNPEQAIEALKKQGFDAIKYPESGIDKFPFDYWDELASKGVSFKNKLPDEPYMTTQVFDPKKIHIIGKDGVAGIKNKLANPLGEYPVLANSKIGEIQKINRLDDYSLTSKEWELQVHIENYANKNNLKFNEAKQEIIDILKTKSQLTDIWNKAQTETKFSKTPIFTKDIQITPEEAKRIIYENIGKEGYTKADLKLMFQEGDGKIGGQFIQNHKIMGDLIKMYETKGKVGLIDSLHESKHFLFSRIAPELQSQAYSMAKKEIGPMYKTFLERAYKKEGAYDGPDREQRLLEEYIVEKWAKSDASRDFGYKKSVFGKIFDALDNVFKKVRDIYQKIEKVLKETPNKQGGFISTGGKEISDADKLISEGKIRVVQREGRDVYQYKNAKKNWVNAPNEMTAVKRVTDEPKAKYEPKDQEKIDFTKAMLEEVRTRLKEHPAKPLLKYLKEGDFQDFKNPNLAKTQKEAQRIKDKNNKIMKTAETAFQDNPKLQDSFDDPDVIRDVIEDYRSQRQAEKSLVESKKFLESTLKPISQIIRERLRPKASLIDTTEGWGRSLEIQIDQARSILDGEVFPMDVSYPQIIENTITPVKNKVNIIDTYLRTPHFVMKKIGFEKEANMLREGADAYWKELPKNIKKIEGWLKTLKTKEAQLAVYQWLDGEAITLPFYEKEVAKQIKNWLKEWADRLKLPEDDKISHYITHVFNREIIEKEFDEELAKIITDKIPKGTYDPFLLERLGKKGYIQDLGLSLDAYVKRATRKVHMDPALEAIREKAGVQLEFSNIEKSQFKYIQRYIENIQMRPSEIEESIDNLIKSIVGYRFGQRPAIALLRDLRQATFRGMIGLNPASALRNLSQGINTYSVLGEKYTTLGYLNLFKKGAMEELEREGILNAGFVQDRVMSPGKKFMAGLDKGLFALFNTVEKINRGSAYFGAKSKGLNQGMSEEQAIKYAKKIVEQTQFLYDAISTPVGMSSGIMKTLFQFQTYTTKQLEFLATINKGKGFKGKDKLKYTIPYLRYIFAGLTFVYTIGKIFGMDPKELLPWYRFNTPPSLKFPVETTKAIINAPDKYGNPRTIKEKLTDVYKSAVGLFPAGSQINKTIQGIMAINQGGSFTSTGKLQFPVGTTLAQKVQAVIFGKYAGEKAQQYFNKDKTDYSSVKPIYEQAQELKNSGNEEEAQSLIDELSDADYELYKQYRTQQKTQETIEGKRDILPKYLEIQKINKENPEEAQKMVDELSDEQYKYYELVKKQIEKDINAGQGETPTFEDGEVQTSTGLINTVFTYAKAIGVDPKTAFDRIFHNERIEYVINNTIVIKRNTGTFGENTNRSTKARKKMGATSDLILDHIIPRQLGGADDERNFILVPKEESEEEDKIENYLGRKLRAGSITKKEAQDLIVKFKSGELSAKEVYNY